jgi:hypothetical protein
MRKRDLIAALAGGAALLALAGSVAWAAIPGDGGVYTACMLKNVGTVRLIDKSLPPGNLMSHCKPTLEVEISWSQRGPQGLQGIQGATGEKGDPGPAGADGADGQSFDGTFTSPNGEYSLSVTNSGITLSHGSDTAFLLSGSDITVLTSGEFRLNAGEDVVVTAGGALAAQSATTTSLQSGSAFTLDAGSIAATASSTIAVQSGASTTMQSASAFSVSGTQVRLNSGSSCAAAARQGDLVVAGAIGSGSPTVCVG